MKTLKTLHIKKDSIISPKHIARWLPSLSSPEYDSFSYLPNRLFTDEIYIRNFSLIAQHIKNQATVAISPNNIHQYIATALDSPIKTLVLDIRGPIESLRSVQNVLYIGTGAQRKRINKHHHKNMGKVAKPASENRTGRPGSYHCVQEYILEPEQLSAREAFETPMTVRLESTDLTAEHIYQLFPKPKPEANTATAAAAGDTFTALERIQRKLCLDLSQTNIKEIDATELPSYITSLILSADCTCPKSRENLSIEHRTKPKTRKASSFKQGLRWLFLLVNITALGMYIDFLNTNDLIFASTSNALSGDQMLGICVATLWLVAIYLHFVYIKLQSEDYTKTTQYTRPEPVTKQPHHPGVTQLKAMLRGHHHADRPNPHLSSTK